MGDERGTVLDRNAIFEGQLEGVDITLHGRFKGNLKASGILRIVEGSRIEAQIEANRVEIDGSFEGNIRADSLHLLGQGRASGSFRAKILTVSEGAKLDGELEIGNGDRP